MDRERLAAALAYEQQKRRRLAETVPGLVTTPAQPAPEPDFLTNLENFSVGMGKGLTNQLEGIKGLVTDPVGTAKGTYEAVKGVVRDPSIIADALRQMGSKAMSGPLGAGEVIGEMIGPMRGKTPMAELDVYHGTPHRFPATEANPLGEFDASKIGTGEGAQAYGHGVYLAESPDIAKHYQTQLGKFYDQMQTPEGAMSLEEAITKYHPDGKAAAKVLSTFRTKTDVDTFNKVINDEILPEIRAKYPQSEWGKFAPQQGTLYKADLPDEMIDRMLDWDKPIKDQPEAVRKAIDRIESEFSMRKQPYKNQEATGFWYGALTDTVGGQQNASKLLKEYGVPGIKYADAGSRGQGGSGTRNFVVFPGEEKKVRILERDGQKAPPQKIAQALEANLNKAVKAEPQPFGVQGYLNDDLRRVKQNFFSQYGVEENKQFSKDYEVVELAKLKPSENTNESKIQSLMKTMREEGNAKDNPIPPIIVDSEGNILDGHHRYEAAKRLGAKYVPIVELFDKRKGPVFSE